MSTVVDERVVRMRFDNDRFEQRARHTLETMSKIKESLDRTDHTKAFEGLDKAAKNVHLEGIAESVDALQRRFSLLGMVGIKAMNGLANSAIGIAKRIYSSTIGIIISGGKRRAENLENAHFQLQALLKDEELVNKVMESANKAVDGTAYSLDSAAKAASQFSATGIQAGEEMTNALRGIVGVSAMTNSDFESISAIFTTVAGQGRVMGDQLNQLASRGLNAASTMADFANGVIDGSKTASDEVTALVKSFSNGTKLTEADIRNLVTKGKISFKLFSESMTEAFADSAERANETFSGALSNVRSALGRIGAGFFSPLIAQNSEIVNLFNTLRLKINEFKKAIVFDESIGNVKALSKQFTDTVLSMAKGLGEFIKNIDVPTIMRNFYYGLETVKNVAKGLWVVVKPILTASATLIRPIGDALHTMLVAVHALTSGLSKSNGAWAAFGDLLNAFAGILSTVFGLFFKMIQKVFTPLDKSTRNTTSAFASFLQTITESIKVFDKWLKTSPNVRGALSYFALSLKIVLGLVGGLGKLFASGVIEGFKTIADAFRGIVTAVADARNIPDMVDKVKTSLSDLSKNRIGLALPKSVQDYIEQAKLYAERVSGSLPKIADAISGALEKIKLSIRVYTAFGRLLKEQVASMDLFGASSEKFTRNIFKMDILRMVLNKIVSAGKEFISFLTNYSATIAGLIVSGGVIYSTLKMAKILQQTFGSIGNALGEVANILKQTSGVLSQTQKTLKAYQHDLNATALLKVAAAIAILSTSLILLSFADPERLINAAVSVGTVGALLISALNVWAKIANRVTTINDIILKVGKQIGKTAKWKAIGGAIKSIGQSILMIVGSIVAIALMYRKDASAMNQAVKLITGIAVVLVGLTVAMELLSKILGSNTKSFMASGIGIAMMAASVTLIVSALNKLFKMKFPLDWRKKFSVLIEILMALTGITAVLNLVSKSGHGGKLNTIPIFLLFTSLHAIISALKRLFKMNLPHDYKAKLGILTMILAELSGLMLAMGAASKLAGKGLKTGGTILAISAFITSFMAALAVLSLFPAEKILVAATAIGGVLVALGTSVMLASKNANPTAFKTVLAMASVIGALIAALSILTVFDAPSLLKGSAALGLVLLAVGKAMEQASKVTDKVSVAAIIAMLADVSVIAYSLYKLSSQPWKGMLASGAAMALVLKTYSDAFSALGSATVDMKQIIKFVAGLTALVPIAGILYFISTQPWDGMAAAGVALGVTILSYSKAFEILSRSTSISLKQVEKFIIGTGALVPIAAVLALISRQPWQGMTSGAVALSAVISAYAASFLIISKAGAINLKQIGAFVLGAFALVPVAAALYLVASKPWDSLLGGAAALSITLAAYSGCFILINNFVRPNMKAIGMLLLGSLALLPIAYALKMVSDQPWQNLIGAATAISEVLLALSVTLGICSIIGNVAGPALIGIALLDLFIVDLVALLGGLGWIVDWLGASDSIMRGIDLLKGIGSGLGDAVGNFVNGALTTVSNQLPEISQNLTDFINLLQPFIDSCMAITPESLEGIKSLGDIIITLAKSEITQGISNILGGGSDFSEFGTQLNNLAPKLKEFGATVAGIDASAVEGAKSAAEIISMLVKVMPREGGWIDRILGSKKTLTEFADELASFGPSLKRFANTVMGINAKSVEGAAAAGNIMAQLASELPPSNGLVQKIFGDKTLAEFGAELMSFGPSIKVFAQTVEGVNEKSVKGAANAGNIMAQLAANIPASGGVLGLLMGNNDIDDFGLRLVSYGNSMVAFSNSVAGLDPSLLNGVKTATEIMTSLATSLPETSGIVGWFSGGNLNIDEFGKQLVKFGGSLSKYAEKVQDIDTTNMSASIDSLLKLVDFMNAVQGVSDFGYGALIDMLSDFSYLNIGDILSPYNNIDREVENAVIGFIQNITSSLHNHVPEIASAMRLNLNALSIGISLSIPLIFENVKSAMVSTGEYITQGLALGMTSKLYMVNKAAHDLANAIPSTVRTDMGINSPSRVMQELGEYTVQGLENGLTSNITRISKIASSLGKTLVDSYKKTMQIHSPSRVMQDAGQDTGEGLAVGTEKSTPAILDSIDGVVGKALDVWDKGSKQIKEELENSKIYEVYGKDAIQKVEDKVQPVVDKVKELTGRGNEEEAKAVAKSGKIKKEAIVQEKTYWEQMLDLKKTGVDKEKYKDVTLADFQKQILEETTDIWKNYTDQLNSSRDSIMSSTNLFAEMQKEEGVKTKDQLKKNLEGQIKAYQDFAETLAAVTARTGDSGLTDYLKTLGVDSLEQLKVINSMTDEELSTYSTMYETKMALATNIASTKLTDLQKETETKLAGVFGGMSEAVNMYDFAATFNGTFESIDEYVQKIMLPIQDSIILAREEAMKTGEAFTEGIEDGLEEAGINDIFTPPLEDAIESAREEKCEDARRLGHDLGEYLREGIEEGITGKAFTETGSALSDEMIDALQNEFEINSPSELTRREVGVYLTEGIAEGMLDGTDSIESSIIDLVKSLTGTFGDNIGTISESAGWIVTAVQNGIGNKQPGLLNDVRNVGNSVVRIMKQSMGTPIVKPVGVNLMTSLVGGIGDKIDLALGTVTTFCENVMLGFNTGLDKNQMEEIGLNAIGSVNNGMLYNVDKASQAAIQVSEEALRVFKIELAAQRFYDIGFNALQGLLNGISGGQQKVDEETAKIANSSVDTAKKVLDEHSPSKVFFMIGKFIPLGLVQGIKRYSKNITEASAEMGDDTVNAMRKAAYHINQIVSSDTFSDEVTIRPLVDLSNVEKSTKDIAKMFNSGVKTKSMAISASGTFNNSPSGGFGKGKAQNGGSTVNHITLEQNNYSPKSLSTVDIYRQTRNQLKFLKSHLG